MTTPIIDPATAPPAPPGVVRADRIKGGWFHVQLGRRRGPKRFNMSEAEAGYLLDRLIVLGVMPSPEVWPLLDQPRPAASAPPRRPPPPTPGRGRVALRTGKR